MKKSIARELIEKNGVDAEALLDMLERAASAEWANYYFYTILRVDLVGADGEALQKILEDVRREDLNHFEALVPRIYELGGKLPLHAVEFDERQSAAIGSLTANAADARALLEYLLKSAEHFVRMYTEICNYTCGKDNRTYGLALAILHEEIEHQVWLLEFLGHGSQERLLRDDRGQSPFVTKFLRSGAGGAARATA
jgi:ferritin-like protein